LAANQLAVDSILDSIDRIADTTEFAGQKLLDGSKAYVLSGVAPDDLASVALHAAHVPVGGSREVVIKVTQSAQTAQVEFVGTTVGDVSRTSAALVEIRGSRGSQMLSFADGTDLAEVQTAVNSFTALTGVSAVVSSPTVGVAASALLLNSVSFGSDALVSVEPISGNFIEMGTANTTRRATGVDVGAVINGQQAEGRGLRADARSRTLDLRVYFAPNFAQTNSSTAFSVTGGGAVFQLTSEVRPNGQLFTGLDRLSSSRLGNAVIGQLYSLRSGRENDLWSRNYSTAQEIVEEAIEEVASHRGRLGSIHKNHIETNINSQKVTLENVTASESIIRDAEMAVEISALTRAEILVQSTQNVLQIANSAPRMVLSLLS
jgi:flagellin